MHKLRGIALVSAAYLLWLALDAIKRSSIIPNAGKVYGPEPLLSDGMIPTPNASYVDLAKKYGVKYGLKPSMLLATMRVESNFHPAIISKPNKNGTIDYGLMQINGTNLASLGLDTNSVLDAEENCNAACKLLTQMQSILRKELKREPTTNELLSANNQGAGGVLKRGIINWPHVIKTRFYMTVYSTRLGVA